MRDCSAGEVVLWIGEHAMYRVKGVPSISREWGLKGFLGSNPGLPAR